MLSMMFLIYEWKDFDPLIFLPLVLDSVMSMAAQDIMPTTAALKLPRYTEALKKLRNPMKIIIIKGEASSS